MGNLGAVKSKCASTELIGQKLEMTCTTGTISAITDIGVYAPESKADFLENCSSKAGIDTGLPNCAYLSELANRQGKGSLSEECLFKTECLVDVSKYLTIGKQKGHERCQVDSFTTWFV
jgi:hypothetical protein